MGTDPVAVAYMNHGRWVADCPRPFCTNAEAFGPLGNGTVGGLEADRFECRAVYGGCGLRCGVEWPANIADLERVLLARPVPGTRNWRPGEHLDDLIAENITHGLIPAEALNRLELGGPGGVVLAWENGQITGGELEFHPAAAIEGSR